ncbi:unnamed protein product, partial [Vitis vinifera]|uniref:Uncharacterized protein n=1 Tax=Vitis vinifera TaxID=29760 RepID=D7SWI8_VITVI
MNVALIFVWAKAPCHPFLHRSAFRSTSLLRSSAEAFNRSSAYWLISQFKEEALEPTSLTRASKLKLPSCLTRA